MEILKVRVNGEEVIPEEALCSAHPINRRWPGRQREKSQAERAYFVRFAPLGRAEVEIEGDFPENAPVRPLCRNVAVEREGKFVRFVLTVRGGYTFGGPRGTLHLFYDPPAEEYKPADGELRFEHGEYDVGELRLSSGSSVYVGEDAVVYCNIVAENAENIRICGRGILDNSRSREKILFPATGDGQADVGNAERKHFISLKNCKNVTIDGPVLRDSLCYNISALDCEDLTIKNVKIIGCWRYNSDGIDLQNCRHCRISDSFLRTYDDCICVKRDKSCGKDCYDILVENCVLWCDWGHALEIGYETCADEIYNIVYRGCVVLRANFDFLNIGCVDYADIHDILYEDLTLEVTGDEEAPFFQTEDGQAYRGQEGYLPEGVNAGIFRHFEYSVGNEYGRIGRLVYRNIAIMGTEKEKVRLTFHGADETHLVQDVLFENLTVNGEKITSLSELAFYAEHAEKIGIK